jgi:CRP-like cAMP-binding protein
LIAEGRVNAIMTRTLTFKTFVKGSYFGDFEFFRMSPRMFSIRVEKDSFLIAISYQDLHKAYKVYPGIKKIHLEKTIQRYLKCNIARIRISHYGRISRNDAYWRERKTKRQPDQKLPDELHKRIEHWIANISKVKEDLNLSSE